MKIILKRPTTDVFVCIMWSLILLPIAFLDMTNIVRIILGLAFLMFIPGYMLSFVLFPLRKTKEHIESVERLALSIALSLAIIPMIGLVLNYTSEGLQPQLIFITTIALIISFGLMALYRWHRTSNNERIQTVLDLKLPDFGLNIDTLLTIILVISIIIAPTYLAYVIIRR